MTPNRRGVLAGPLQASRLVIIIIIIIITIIKIIILLVILTLQVIITIMFTENRHSDGHSRSLAHCSDPRAKSALFGPSCEKRTFRTLVRKAHFSNPRPRVRWPSPSNPPPPPLPFVPSHTLLSIFLYNQYVPSVHPSIYNGGVTVGEAPARCSGPGISPASRHPV